MTKAFLALAAALFIISPVMADDCQFVSDGETLSFASPTEVSVEGAANYTCSTSSGGTGVSGRVAHCSDGFDGAMLYNEDESITFRDAVWTPTCEDGPVIDLMGN